MSDSVSTETAILASCLGQKMPNLRQYIIEYSTAKSNRSATTKPSPALSPQQTQRARQYPNAVILQALNATITIQTAMNTVNTKLGKLLKQQSTIENTLVRLLTTDDDESSSDDSEENNQDERSVSKEPISDTKETLQQSLIDLNQGKKRL